MKTIYLLFDIREYFDKACAKGLHPSVSFISSITESACLDILDQLKGKSPNIEAVYIAEYPSKKTLESLFPEDKQKSAWVEYLQRDLFQELVLTLGHFFDFSDFQILRQSEAEAILIEKMLVHA